MPDVPLLQPVVLNGVIEKFTAPETLLGRTQLFGGDRVNRSPDPYVSYDVIEGARQMAKPNVPNSEAHIVKQLGVGHITASMIYLRDKKVFSPTTLRWLRQPGTLNQKDAEAAVLREIRDLDNRFERFAEYLIWSALTTGALSFTGGGVVIAVDYLVRNDHKPTASPQWSHTDAGPPVTYDADIIGDVQTWKRLVSRNAQAVLTDVYMNATVMKWLINNAAIRALMIGSQRRTDELLNTGKLTGLLGLTWHEYDIAYVDDNGTVTYYIPDTTAVFLSNDNPDRWYFYEGPSADDEAPPNHIGKFAKTWKEPDPSNRQYLLEWHIFPGIWRPDQLIIADVA